MANGDSGSDADLSEFGAPNNNVGTYFICSKDGNTPSPQTGNISLQRDLATPVAIVLENNIGNIWFDYVGTGAYTATLDGGGFDSNKTAIFLSNSAKSQNGIVWTYVEENDGHISIETARLVGDYDDNILAGNTFEIRVYN